MPIDLYFAHLSPPSRTAYMVAKELGLEVNLKMINVVQGEHKSPEYLKMNPQHTIPTINDNGFVLWDSHAIATYLFGKYGDAKKDFLYPKDLKKRALVDRLLHFEGGTLFPPFHEYIVTKLGIIPGDHEIGEKKLHSVLEFLETFLEKGPYLTGDHYTLADISVLATIFTLEAMDFDFSIYPKTKAWSNLLKSQLPYFTECNDTACEIAKHLQKK